MGQAVKFPGCNFVFKSPPDVENVNDLDVFTNGSHNVLAVELTPEEHKEYMKTGRIFVSVISGPNFFPIFVGTETTCRELLLQTNSPVWPSTEDLAQQKILREVHKLLGADQKRRDACRDNPQRFNVAVTEIKRLLFNAVKPGDIRPILKQYLEAIK